VPTLHARSDGVLWIDMAAADPDAERVLTDVLRLHPRAVREVRERTHLPKVHAYADHLFIVLHAPEIGERGHVHLVELDQVLGRHHLVTIHGPFGPGVELEMATRETRDTLERIRAGRVQPQSAADLSHAIVSRLARREEELLSGIATRIAVAEKHVRHPGSEDPEKVLEDMYLTRHELLTIRTVAAQSREIYGRILARGRFPVEERHLFEDLEDQFDRVRGLGDGEKEFLEGAISFFVSRTTTRMNIAMERLALIAALVLPITAIASIYGMNVIVNQSTDMAQLIVALAVMLALTGGILYWTRRHGWW
jgi:magnesium transporter